MYKTHTIALSLIALSVFAITSPALAANKYKNQRADSPTRTMPRQTKPATTTPPVATPAPTAPVGSQCSTGWYITGYFTPVESDYTGATRTVTVAGASYAFNSAFLTEVETEGWGRTRLGNYIGNYDNAWHFSATPLDAYDHALQMDAVAVDTTVVKAGSKLTIPTLPAPFTSKVFTATDIGNGVTGKHIDVYMGEGKAAEALTYTITGNNKTVCITK